MSNLHRNIVGVSLTFVFVLITIGIINALSGHWYHISQITRRVVALENSMRRIEDGDETIDAKVNDVGSEGDANAMEIIEEEEDEEEVGKAQ